MPNWNNDRNSNYNDIDDCNEAKSEDRSEMKFANCWRPKMPWLDRSRVGYGGILKKRPAASRLISTSIKMLIVLANLLAIILCQHQLFTQASIPDIYSNNSLKSLTSSGLHHNQIVATFSTPNQAINISHVTYDPLYDKIYLGASNALYQLNGNDLSEEFDQITGPIQDHPLCGITECNGYEDFMKSTTNFNKLLVIDYQHEKLLACFSTKQGACRRYQLNNISQKEDLISMAVAANDDNSSTYAFIAPARYYDNNEQPDNSSPLSSLANNNQQQQVLYVGTTYTKVGQSRDLLVPAIGTRRLDDGPNLLKLYENSFLDSARIDINSHLRDYFLVNYLYGFSSANYIYFITLQRKATSRDYEELGYHTRIARICITDSSYNSYTEVDLKCVAPLQKFASSRNNNNKLNANIFSSSSNQDASSQQQTINEYPLLQDAILIDAGSQLLQSLMQNDENKHQHQTAPTSSSSSSASNSFSFAGSASSSSSASPDDNKVLLGVFSSSRDHTQHPGDHSALCAFSLSQIEEKFNQNIHNCYTGKMSSRNMEYIAGNVQECPKNGQGGNVVNFCHETLKINGTQPIISEAQIQFANTTLTAVTATSQISLESATTSSTNIYSSQLANDLMMTPNQPSSSSSSIMASNSSQRYQQQHQQQQLFFKQQAQQLSQAQNTQTVAYLGTSNGYIKKILLNNASAGHEFEQVQLDPASSAPVLSDLHLHSSGRFLIAANPYKVFKLALENCGQHSNCRSCSQSKNPYCGWCSLKKSCTTKSECSSSGPEQPANSAISFQQRLAAPAILLNSNGNSNSISNKDFNSKWISSESPGKCIDLQAIVPDKIPITSTGKIDLHVDRLPRLPAGHSYRCIFDRREQTNATPTRQGVSCPLPKVIHRPKIEPGRDHAIVEVALRSSETNTDFLNGKITFFECQLHTTCKDCLTTNWACNWCLNENICLFNTSKCERSARTNIPSSHSQLIINQNGNEHQQHQQHQQQMQPIVLLDLESAASTNPPRRALISGGQVQANANTIGLVGQCPTFDLRDKQDILIPDGSEHRELSIRVKNMPQVKGPIQCLVEIESTKIQLNARIEHDRVICDNSSYSYSAEVGLLNAQLVVLYTDNNIIIDRTNFTLYKCHLLGAHLGRADCSLCKRIESQFQCSWCSGSCRHKSRCPAGLAAQDNSCPAPRIDSVWPLSGPIYGGTRLTIEGSNLGQSFEEIENRVRLGNSTCRPLESEYRVSNRIVCITGPLQVNNFMDTSNNININDHANYLANGRLNNQGLMLASDHMATSGASASLMSQKWTVDIEIGNRAGYSLAPNKFQFKPIYLRDHQPRYGPQSGGTRITLTGTNLNVGSSVQVFLDELPCVVEQASISSEQLTCRTSPSKHPSRWIRQLKLVIDDAQIIRDGSVFLYTQDPTITRISPLRSYLSGGRPINVFGTNLTSVQAPRMVLLDPQTGRKVNESLCLLHDDPTLIQCPSPTVNLNSLDQAALNSDSSWPTIGLGGPEQHGASVSYLQKMQLSGLLDPFGDQPAPVSTLNNNNNFASQEESLLKFKITFVMDDVPFDSPAKSSSNPVLNSEIIYTADPKLYPFASSDYKSAQEASSLSLVGAGDPMHLTSVQQRLYQLDADTYLIPQQEPVLVLHGEHLRTAVSDYEITVTIGTDTCNFTQLTQTKLICSVALDRVATPTDEEGRPTARQLPLVVVRIGFNLRFELGYVQYHPQLVEQIFRNVASAAGSSSAHRGPFDPISGYGPPHGTFMPPQNYMPSERENFLHKVGSYIFSAIIICLYLTLGATILFFVYTSFNYANKLQEKCKLRNQYKRVVSRIESIEKSVRGECRLASMALQSELNELIGHIELTGCPIIPRKLYISRLLFGVNSQQRLNDNKTQGNKLNNNDIINLEHSNYQQQHQFNVHQVNPLISTNTRPNAIERPLIPASCNDSSLDNFQILLFNKTFLINFINTLERQPGFSIRDRQNVGSLLSVCLLNKPDYMLDILRTLVLQHIERCLAMTDDPNGQYGARNCKTRSSVKGDRRSNITKTLLSRARLTNQASNLSKVVSGSANSLMASTQVAAQMLLSRVGGQTLKNIDEPSLPNWVPAPSSSYHHTINLHGSAKQQQQQQQHHCLNTTTTFNQRHIESAVNHQTLDPRSLLNAATTTTSSLAYLNGATASQSSSLINPFLTDSCYADGLAAESYLSSSSKYASSTHSIFGGQSQDTCITERILFNWLAVNMYDHFHGQLGQSLYLLFEALKHQLNRGPIDSISGDAYYSLDCAKLLREPNIPFETVNLYLIVDAELLQPAVAAQNVQRESIYEDPIITVPRHSSYHHPNLSSLAIGNNSNRTSTCSNNNNNTITLTVRVLDCDTISQVKAKCLDALYRNSPASNRLRIQDVELMLRQEQQQHQADHSVNYSNVQLKDEDESSVVASNGSRRINTLRHYGVCEQAIMMLNKKKIAQATQQMSQNLNDIICGGDAVADFNPYSEILYGPLASNANNDAAQHAGLTQNHQQQVAGKLCHLTTIGGQPNQHGQMFQTSRNCLYLTHSEESSPGSISPSMMLLSGEHPCTRINNLTGGENQSNNNNRYQYHPSSSSSSSGQAQLDHSSSMTSTSAANCSQMSKQLISNNQQRLHQNHQNSVMAANQHQPAIYCQIGSVSARSQQNQLHPNDASEAGYYCQIGTQSASIPASNHGKQINANYFSPSTLKIIGQQLVDSREGSNSSNANENEQNVYLSRMLATKGTVQSCIDNLFNNILDGKSISTNRLDQYHQRVDYNESKFLCADVNAAGTTRRRAPMSSSPGGQLSGACPPAVKWLFDLLDEAAMKNGITDQSVLDCWKSNVYLVRFWSNLIKNPQLIFDVESSNTLDAALSVIADTLVESCKVGASSGSSSSLLLSAVTERDCNASLINRLIFASDIPKYGSSIKNFNQDVGSMKPVHDQELASHIAKSANANTSSLIDCANDQSNNFKSAAMKELCNYAINHENDLISTLNNDFISQQMNLANQFKNCIRSFAYYESF